MAACVAVVLERPLILTKKKSKVALKEELYFVYRKINKIGKWNIKMQITTRSEASFKKEWSSRCHVFPWYFSQLKQVYIKHKGLFPIKWISLRLHTIQTLLRRIFVLQVPIVIDDSSKNAQEVRIRVFLLRTDGWEAALIDEKCNYSLKL